MGRKKMPNVSHFTYRFTVLKILTSDDMLVPIGRCRVESRLPEVVLYVDIGPLVVEQRSDNADAPIE